MKLTPMAVWRSCSSPRPGGDSSLRSHLSTSALPCSWNTIALVGSERMRQRRLRLSERGVVGLTGADADHAIDIGNENLAVADLAGLGGLHHRFHDLVHELGAHRDFDARLRHEINDVLGPAVEFGMAALPAEALDLGYGHARYADLGQGGPDGVELEGLYNCGYRFHTQAPASILVGFTATAKRKCTFRATTRPPQFCRLSPNSAPTSTHHGTNSAPSRP